MIVDSSLLSIIQATYYGFGMYVRFGCHSDGMQSWKQCPYLARATTAKRLICNFACKLRVHPANCFAHRSTSSGTEAQLADAQTDEQTGEVGVSCFFPSPIGSLVLKTNA